jgi:hypothetical protein
MFVDVCVYREREREMYSFRKRKTHKYGFAGLIGRSDMAVEREPLFHSNHATWHPSQAFLYFPLFFSELR